MSLVALDESARGQPVFQICHNFFVHKPHLIKYEVDFDDEKFCLIYY